MRGALAQETERSYTVAGVMPPGFSGTIDEDASEFWLPIEQYTPRVLLERRTTHMIWALGRLRPGATLASAQAELAGIGQRLAAEHPDAYRERVLRVEPVGEISRERFRAGLLMLSGAAAMLLLIAYANVANLLLARHARRAGELAMRRVLGAGRWRILRQLLLESVLLAGAGGMLGAALAFVGVRVFVARDVLRMPDYLRVEPDLRIFGLALVLVLVTAILFGVAPAWLGAKRSASERLADSRLRGGGAGRRERSLGDLLQAAEVALAFLLLLGSAMMLRTYSHLLRSDVGFRTEHLLRMAVSLDPAQYPDPESRLAFAREARARLEAQPGVRRASIMASVLPPWFDTEVRIAAGGEEREEIAVVPLHGIDTAFLDVLDIPLLRGRAFGDRDHAAAPRVALVSESLARALQPSLDGEPLGRSIQTITRDGTLSAPVEVVGVVADVRYNGPLAAPRAAGFTDLYLPLEQIPDEVLSIALWTDTDPAALVDSMQRVLGGIAPTSPQHWISTMEQELALQHSEARVQAWLTSVFGAAALVLVVLGLYGVLTHTVTRRFHELAVRQAVGARGRDIVAMVLGEGSRTMLLGLAAGAALALAGARLLGTLLYGVAPNDPATFLVVAVALYGLGLAACAVPARRAARVAPIEALRG
jgi:predicted permease